MASKNARAMQELLDKAKAQGCKITMNKKGHWRVLLPNGEITFCSQTPSDYHAVKNQRSIFRKAGLNID